jgi:hypothetical protein
MSTEYEEDLRSLCEKSKDLTERCNEYDRENRHFIYFVLLIGAVILVLIDMDITLSGIAKSVLK